MSVVSAACFEYSCIVIKGGRGTPNDFLLLPATVNSTIALFVAARFRLLQETTSTKWLMGVYALLSAGVLETYLSVALNIDEFRGKRYVFYGEGCLSVMYVAGTAVYCLFLALTLRPIQPTKPPSAVNDVD